MDGDLLDLVLLLAVLLFAVSGYRQGLLVGLLSFVGFLGGGLLGAQLAPTVATRLVPQLTPALVGLVLVFVLASLGQVIAAAVGGALRGRITWGSARTVDAVGGAAVSAVSVLLVAWLVGTAVVGSPFRTLAAQVQGSAVLGAVDTVVPTTARTWFSSFRRLIDESDFPRVFGGLGTPAAVPVQPPDPAVAGSQAVKVAQEAIVKVTGQACGRNISGSGFVYSAGHVMTNAHVVAGVTAPTVVIPDGRRLSAKVVVYDPQRDVAVLLVPGLSTAPLQFAGAADDGANAIVAGYPLDGPFRVEAARVRNTQTARGPDIYQSSTVTRQIYAVRSKVLPGNSGGPLLAPDGSVYGVVFAAASDDPETGYALTAKEVAPVAQAGATATRPVSTQGCD